jgi:hypothetical protein
MRLTGLLLIATTVTAYAGCTEVHVVFVGGTVLGRASSGGSGDLTLGPAVGVEALGAVALNDDISLGFGIDGTYLPVLKGELPACSLESGYEMGATANLLVHGSGFVWRAGLGFGGTGFTGPCLSLGGRDGWGAGGPVVRTSVAWPLSRDVQLAVEVRAGEQIGGLGGFADYMPGMLLVGLQFGGEAPPRPLQSPP